MARINQTASQKLAAQITRNSSKQSYYTIRFLVDRSLVDDAYRAYAYFRWVDDILDAETGTQADRLTFIHRQQHLLESGYQCEILDNLTPEEHILADLIRNDTEENSGLQSYLRNMMAVMAFDVDRRNRLVTEQELDAYTNLLSLAVTDALMHFIGHNSPAPMTSNRYLPVQGAHIIHMLRDMLEDTGLGYFNIPKETIESQGFTFQDVDHPSYRKWVADRVELANSYFRAGREYLTRIKCLLCKIACCAYIARFEWMAHIVKHNNYRLRQEYPERKSLQAGLWMTRKILSTLFNTEWVDSWAVRN